MAATLVASSAPSTSGRPCASTPASSCSARSAACARPPQQARCPQRRQWRRWQQRHLGGGSCRAAASGPDKPEWFQALEETAHLDEDVARLLASAKNNPDAVRRRMQEGKNRRGVGWLDACTSRSCHLQVCTQQVQPYSGAARGTCSARQSAAPAWGSAADQEQLHAHHWALASAPECSPCK